MRGRKVVGEDMRGRRGKVCVRPQACRVDGGGRTCYGVLCDVRKADHMRARRLWELEWVARRRLELLEELGCPADGARADGFLSRVRVIVLHAPRLWSGGGRR